MENLLLFGIPLPVLVGVLVEILKKVGMVSDGNQARIANIIISGIGAIAVSLLAEYGVVFEPIVITIVLAVYTVIVSAIGYEQTERFVEYRQAQIARK